MCVLWRGGERGRDDTCMHVETREERNKVFLITKVPKFEKTIRLIQARAKKNW